jgi:proliferating cell nuclear antigen
MSDAHGHVMIELSLEEHNFIYKFKPHEKMYLGINLTHFHKMLRSIKKKDTISMYIDDDKPDNLGIRVTPKEKNRTSSSFIKIQKTQAVKLGLPTGYDGMAIVPSSEFQKMCKDMAHIDKTVYVNSEGYNIKFTCGAEGVMGKIVEFGECGDSDSDSDDNEKESKVYEQSFDTDQLRRITKISGLGTKMRVYAKMGLPLKFCSGVGELGNISLYIKSREQILEESLKFGTEQYSEDDSDEESDL